MERPELPLLLIPPPHKWRMTFSGTIGKINLHCIQRRGSVLRIGFDAIIVFGAARTSSKCPPLPTGYNQIISDATFAFRAACFQQREYIVPFLHNNVSSFFFRCSANQKPNFFYNSTRYIRIMCPQICHVNWTLRGSFRIIPLILLRGAYDDHLHFLQPLIDVFPK